MKHKKEKKKKKRRSPSTSSSSSQESNEWVEKSPPATSRQLSVSSIQKAPQQDSSLGSSFLDLALSSSSSREKKEKATPANKIQPIELPIGLYYPNKKQETDIPTSRYENKHKEKFHESSNEYDSQRKNIYATSERQNSRDFQKPSSDDKYYSDRKDKYDKSERQNRRFQKPNSDDEYDLSRKDKYVKSERQNRRFQKPSTDDEYDSPRKDKYDKSERQNRRFQKPSTDDEYDSPRKDKYHKSDRQNSKQFQKPSSDDEYDSPRKDKYHKSDRQNSKQFQKPSSDDEYDSRRKNIYTKSGKQNRQFQKPSSDSEDNDSERKGKSEKQNNTQRNDRENNVTQSGNSESCSKYSNPDKFKAKDEKTQKGDSSSSNSSAQKLPVLHDDVNKIAAKLIKAEMMGNTELASKLKAKLEAAKSQEIVYKRHGPDSKKTNAAEDKGRVVVVSEQNMKDRRRTELLERKKLAFLGDNEDRWVSEGKSFPNIGDEYEEEETPKRKKHKTDSSSSLHANAIQDHKRTAQKLNSCIYCLSSANKNQPILVDQYSEQVYLALPGREPLVPHHCMIVTRDHVANLRATEPNTYNSIRSLCEKLVTVFSRQQKTCVFFEMVNNIKWNHCHVHCVPLSRDVGDLAPLYFQKSISDLEADTRHNKTLTKIEKNKLRTSIPTEMEYFYVNFDWGNGFAHVIENKLSNTFAEEIIGGMLDLNPSQWRNPTLLTYETQIKHKLDFLNIYKN